MKISVRDEREENGKPVPERKTGRAANCGQGETGAAAQMPEREKTEKGKLRKVNGTLMLKIAGAVVFCLVLAWLASMDILKDVHEYEWDDTITTEEKAVLRMPGFGMTIYLIFLFLFGLAAVLTERYGRSVPPDKQCCWDIWDAEQVGAWDDGDEAEKNGEWSKIWKRMLNFRL